MMTTYNYGILSMQKTYNSRLECPQGSDLKTVSHIPYILRTAADDGSANRAIVFSIQCRVEICDRCTIHLAASSVSSASPTPPQVSEYDYLRSITHPITSQACKLSTYPRIICIISISDSTLNFHLEDPSDYALLASSGCYRLPAGIFSDDSIAMDELRAAMGTLGFKPKHMTSIFSLLVAILLTTYPRIICIISISAREPLRMLLHDVINSIAVCTGTLLGSPRCFGTVDQEIAARYMQYNIER